MLRLSFATGTEPGKWFARFRDNTSHGDLVTIDRDDALEAVLDGECQLGLVRLPAGSEDPRVDSSFHVVHLYEEAAGIAVPKDSIYAEVGEPVLAADVRDEHVNYILGADGSVDVDAVRAGLQVVAANVGIVIAPRPLLKVLSKKQVVPLGYVDDSVATTRIALVWRKDDDCDAIQDFVGIAKGRTKNSSRQERPKLSAREKTKAKQARRAAAQGAKRTAGNRATKALSKRKQPSGQRKRRSR